MNLVAEVALFLQHFYSDINKDNIELVNRIMQTLVELCVVSDAVGKLGMLFTCTVLVSTFACAVCLLHVLSVSAAFASVISCVTSLS